MTNKNAVFKILIIIIAIAILVSVMYLALPKQTPQQQESNATLEVTCNAPYIKVGTTCCLDQNSNSICDSDENEKLIPLQTPKQQELQTPTQIVTATALPEDKKNQPQLVLEIISKDTLEPVIEELARGLQKKDSIKVKVSDPRYATPVEQAKVMISTTQESFYTNALGIAVVNISKAGSANLTAYKEKFNKSNLVSIYAFETYTAGTLYSEKGIEAGEVQIDGKWTAWSFNSPIGRKIALVDNELKKEFEFNFSNSTFNRPVLQTPYLLLEKSTSGKIEVLAYEMHTLDLKAIANKSTSSYSPSMHQSRIAIITSELNDAKCLSDSKIEIVDLHGSPHRQVSNVPRQFALLFYEDNIYYADLNAVQNCNFNASLTIPIYKTSPYLYAPVKILEIKKPSYFELSALEYPYTVNGKFITYSTLNNKGGTSIHTYDLKSQLETTLTDDDSKVVKRSKPYFGSRHVAWSELASDGNWHVRLYNTITKQLKWATWNDQNQTKPVIKDTTIYYVQNSKIYALQVQNE